MFPNAKPTSAMFSSVRFSRPVCRLFTAGLLSLLFFALQINVCLPQAIPAILHKRSNLNDLMKYYRERLVEITVTDSITEEQSFGTGFLVSSKGWVVTAKHVVSAVLSSPKYKVNVRIHDGLQAIDVFPIGGKYRLSEHSDIALFQIQSPGGEAFKYMCVDAKDSQIDPSETVTLGSFTVLGKQWGQGRPTFKEHADITHISGPGDMIDYLGVSMPIEASMSGGAVVREKDDRVIAVISNVLELRKQGIQLPGENYANLLSAATDLAELTNIPDCKRPGEEDFQRIQNQSQFMASTPEGTIAWIPDGPTGEYFSFSKAGLYTLQRKYLHDCSDGAPTWKEIRFVINHSMKGACDSKKSTCDLGSAASTYYGVQVVPIFLADDDPFIIPQNAWLYRNTPLLSRKPSGAFTRIPDDHVREKLLDATPPSVFNEYTTGSRPDILQLKACDRKLTETECEDLLAVKKFNESSRVLQKWPWHGYTRKDANPPSTLDVPDERIWRVPDIVLKSNNYQVKNWILQYTATIGTTSKNPVVFSFCPDSRRKEYYIRVFSPERSVNSEPIHIILSD
jgi:hypothetical protein